MRHVLKWKCVFPLFSHVHYTLALARPCLSWFWPLRSKPCSARARGCSEIGAMETSNSWECRNTSTAWDRWLRFNSHWSTRDDNHSERNCIRYRSGKPSRARLDRGINLFGNTRCRQLFEVQVFREPSAPWTLGQNPPQLRTAPSTMPIAKAKIVSFRCDRWSADAIGNCNKAFWAVQLSEALGLTVGNSLAMCTCHMFVVVFKSTNIALNMFVSFYKSILRSHFHHSTHDIAPCFFNFHLDDALMIWHGPLQLYLFQPQQDYCPTIPRIFSACHKNTGFWDLFDFGESEAPE